MFFDVGVTNMGNVIPYCYLLLKKALLCGTTYAVFGKRACASILSSGTHTLLLSPLLATHDAIQ